MRRLRVTSAGRIAGLIAAGTILFAASGCRQSRPPAHAVRIMPLGDSITQGAGRA